MRRCAKISQQKANPMQPDYEFKLGPGRHLRGHGYRGLLALAIFLAALFVTTLPAHRLTTAGFSLLWNFMTRSAGAS
jgi:hypothetical protein